MPFGELIASHLQERTAAQLRGTFYISGRVWAFPALSPLISGLDPRGVSIR